MYVASHAGLRSMRCIQGMYVYTGPQIISCWVEAYKDLALVLGLQKHITRALGLLKAKTNPNIAPAGTPEKKQKAAVSLLQTS